MEAAIALVGLAASPVRPPARVKERLLRSLRGTDDGRSGGPIEVRPGICLVRTDFLPWGQHPSPGVRIKEVLSDPASQTRSFLIELGPGSVFPDHEHGGVEELFVFRGSFSVAGQVLRTGDFCRSEPGTRDWDIRSEEGALLLVTVGPPRSSASDSVPDRL
ncbi:MAG: cupin domain-containing protein [Acidobacteriota bacterium]|nr:cupin domain-containing protein [Acidobacteriota bacterium]